MSCDGAPATDLAHEDLHPCRRTRGVRDQAAVGRERGIDLQPRLARDLNGLADGKCGVARGPGSG